MTYLALYRRKPDEIFAQESFDGRPEEENLRLADYQLQQALLRLDEWSLYVSKEKAFSWEDLGKPELVEPAVKSNTQSTGTI